MFLDIFKFEIKSAFKKPMVYIFSLVYFALVFAASATDNVQIGGGNDAININAPYVMMKMTLMMTFVGVFITTAFLNSAILKDYEHHFDQLIFSTPISKLSYLGGRYLSAFVLSLVPYVAALLGFWLASVSGMVDDGQVGAFTMNAYVQTMLIGVIPNVFLVSAVIFMLAALFKSNLYSFMGAVGLIIMYLLMESFVGNLEHESLAIMLDPLGVNSFDIVTKYWTIEEKNNNLVGFTGPFSINRLIWISVGILIVWFTFLKFSYTKKSKKNNANQSEETAAMAIYNIVAPLPSVSMSDSVSTQWSQYLFQLWIETKGILKSLPFIVITMFSIVNMYGGLSAVEMSYGTGNHPVTYLMVEGIRGSLHIFLLILIMYYTGVLIWKERDMKYDDIIDATSMPQWIPYMSKITALLIMVVFILMLAIGCGVVLQLTSGYTHLELGVYARELLMYDLLEFVGLIAFSMCIQTLVNNKYLGYFVFLVSIIALKFGPSALEISSNMVTFGNVPSYTYSDMNKWNVFENGLMWFHTYWTLMAGLLTVLGVVFWVRGREAKLSNRLTQAKVRFSGSISAIAIVLGVLWLGTSSFLFYQTTMINDVNDRNEREKNTASYEKLYAKYAHIPQPRITALDYEIDIYPEERKFRSEVTVTVANKTDRTIAKIHFSLQDGYDIDLHIDGAQVELMDTVHHYAIYQLANPMAPGSERIINVSAEYTNKGIENEVSNLDIIENGSFISNDRFMPIIGYDPNLEISDKKTRKEYGLATKKGLAKPHEGCSASCANSYLRQDSDWVSVTSTIGTSSDQIAIAPGSLVKSWEENGRSYFEYEVEEKVLNFYSFISGRYEVARDVWISDSGHEVDVEVYYHKGHEYNLDKMISSIKNSLGYFTSQFAEYPHSQARIIEFPRYESFAQAFPGTMPYSESMGFIADLKEEHAIDMVYYYVAHEMAHQWWAHQVIGADVQGATMLSESFAQYSALMVMKEKYGSDKMKQFMKYEMDRYLRGRAREDDQERPLMFNENQSYIHYAKGSVVMYALQEYIGEDKINGALKAFAMDKAYQEPPYTNSIEFLDYLRDATPDSLQYLLVDMVENITLYDNRTVDAYYQQLDDGKYEVTINTESIKYRADSLGKELMIPTNDYIEIGIFSEEINEGERYGRPILIKKVKVSDVQNTFKMIVDEEPYTAGIDPNYLLVDRMPEDNVKRVEVMDK